MLNHADDGSCRAGHLGRCVAWHHLLQVCQCHACEALKIRVSTVRFRPWPPRVSLQKRQPSPVGVFVFGAEQRACRSTLHHRHVPGAGQRPCPSTSTLRRSGGLSVLASSGTDAAATSLGESSLGSRSALLGTASVRVSTRRAISSISSAKRRLLVWPAVGPRAAADRTRDPRRTQLPTVPPAGQCRPVPSALEALPIH